MQATAKLFFNGRSQAVRIPKAYRFEGVDEVIIRKEGDALVIAPVRKTWKSNADEAPPVGDDFMADRPELTDSGRVAYTLMRYTAFLDTDICSYVIRARDPKACRTLMQDPIRLSDEVSLFSYRKLPFSPFEILLFHAMNRP